MGLFGYDRGEGPSPKKILFYCVVITALLLLLGVISTRMGNI